MKRIKQIIEALKVIGMQPGGTIGRAYTRIASDAEARDEEDMESTPDERILIGNIIDAVVAIAEDMEKPKAESESKA
jgi:hypothetical protein